MLSNNNTNSIQSNFRDYSIYKNEKTNYNNVGLTQGDKFLNYQNKIKKQMQGSNNSILLSNDSKEGFTMNLKEDTNDTLKETNFTPDERSTLRKLKLEYAAVMKIYQKLQLKFKEKTHQFFKRVDPAQNKFLGKNIRFREGEQCYVTMQGVARYYNNADIDNATSGKNGCPALADYIVVDIPWKNEYARPGATIPTHPPLISGPPMTMEQACGNEGSNVYVNTSISTQPTYIGAFVNNDNSGITYLGARPPGVVTVQNPNFSTPALQNDSYTIMTSSMPGWSGNAQIVNNSSAWGFPIPYPGGGQCLTIQGTAVFSQTFSNLDVGTYTLSFQACGRPRYGSVLVNLNLNGVTFYTVNIGDTFVWTPLSVNFTVSQAGANTLAFQAMNPAGNTGDNSTAFTAISLIFGADGSDPPTFTYDMCKTQAMTQGYQYFGLTHATEDKGYCVATKDYISATGTGTSYKIATMPALWSTGTNGKGAYAKLTSMGTLQVYDSNNQSVYSTPAPDGTGSDSFWGCYTDAANTGAARSIPNMVGDQNTSLLDCRTLAESRYSTSLEEVDEDEDSSKKKKKKDPLKKKKKKKKHEHHTELVEVTTTTIDDADNSIYAVQYAINGNGNNGQCFVNTANPGDFMSALGSGPATNCTKDSDGRVIGQGWSNAIYGTKPGFGCILLLQDDGNMCIYRGQSDMYNMDQNRLWASDTSDGSLVSNPNWLMSDGKYGRNWVYNGFNGILGSDNGCILYPGESIFSSNGKLFLTMQTDGNLVLYTSTIEPNERTDSKGNKISDQKGYALYGFDDNPNPGYNGTLGYIDGGGTFHKYTDGANLIDDSYTKYSSLQQVGYQYTINGEQYSQKSLADCKKTCTDDAGCGGVTYYTPDGTCYYNSSDVSLYDTVANEFMDTYMKNKEPANPLYTKQINNISGAMHDRYTMGQDMPNGVHFNLQSATAVISSELSHAEDKLNQLAGEISKYNAEFVHYNKKILDQSKENVTSSKEYLNEYDLASKQIKREKKVGSNLDAILDDTNILVLQENYNYTLWSLLAVGIGIASIILVKK